MLYHPYYLKDYFVLISCRGNISGKKVLEHFEDRLGDLYKDYLNLFVEISLKKGHHKAEIFEEIRNALKI